MRKYFRELDELFKQPQSVLTYIDEIKALRAKLSSDEDVIEFVNKVRGKVQNEATQAVIDNHGGMVAMATGSGKSKVAIDVIKHYELRQHALIVPTEKLRDENWLEEFIKWDAQEQYTATARLCYASASKIKDLNIGVAVLDEGHNITELGAEFFSNNEVDVIALFTATPPTDKVKVDLLNSLGIKLVYEVTLDQAVELGFVAPYKITVVTVPLDNATKNIPGGTKDKPFMTTESSAYAYWNKRVQQCYGDSTPRGQAKMKFAILGRMQFIYKLPSKTAAIKFLLEKVIPKDDRTLIFCGSIEQAKDVCPWTYHSKSDDKDYDAFKAEVINRLSCVKSINEGHNFPGIDSGIIGQLNSKEKDLVQRIGRLIRFRPGHEAHLWIVVSEGTQDEKWLEGATAGLDQSKIEHVRFTNFKTKYDGN